MKELRRAIATWLGPLSRGGVIREAIEEEGVALAAEVIGTDQLSELREFMRQQDKVEVRQQERAAIRVCIATAHANRTISKDERELLSEIVQTAELDPDVRNELHAQIGADDPSIAGIENELTHPVLRELLLGLSWEVVISDGRVDDSERTFHHELAARFGTPEDRAQHIRDRISARVER